MNLEFIYPKKVDKFLEKNSHILKKEDVRELLIKSIKKIILKENINIDVKRLKGKLKHFYRIRQNKIRIVFEIVNNEVIIKLIIKDIDFRGGVYD